MLNAPRETANNVDRPTDYLHFFENNFPQNFEQCDQMGDLLDFGQLFKACGNN